MNELLKIKPSHLKPFQPIFVNLQKKAAEEAEAEANVSLAKKNTLKIKLQNDNGVRADEILRRLRATQNKINKEAEIVLEEVPVEVEPLSSKKKLNLKKKLVLKEDTKRDKTVLTEEEHQLLNKEPILEEIEEIKNDFVSNKPRISIKKHKEKKDKNTVVIGEEDAVKLGDKIKKRLPQPVVLVDIKASSYYMNNRDNFIKFINGVFGKYKDDLLDETKSISCDDIGQDTGKVSLLTHQKIVRDYINLYSPYRGLLLYHGLGSGKTCSSIAIAEGVKSSKQVWILTPASLRRNYIEEIKKCGDLLYRKNQFWEWISIEKYPKYLAPLASALGLTVEYLRKQGGAWLTNITKESNYSELSTGDKKRVNTQIDEMILSKYKFINYNGIRRDRFRNMTDNFEKNIFDGSIVIIDEAHNLISRIVNKLNKSKKKTTTEKNMDMNMNGPVPMSLALILYDFLLKANDCRIVLLTGTPIINYPNEIGILFNILRGYIKTWSFTLTTQGSGKLSKQILQDLLVNEKVMDYVDYLPSSKTLTITRNPYGFENKITENSGYKGVTNDPKRRINDLTGEVFFDERGTISDADFVKRVSRTLSKNDITVSGTSFSAYTALPDGLDEFINSFIDKDTGNVKNTEKFKRRIIGLTSYFRSAQEELLPKYDKTFDYHVEQIPMSDYQFGVYERYRQDERKSEKPSKGPTVDKNGLFVEPSSTYRIFSRLACNFVMPTPPGRPMPSAFLGANDITKSFVKMFSTIVEQRVVTEEQKDKIIQRLIDYERGHSKTISNLKKDESRILEKNVFAYIDDVIEEKFDGTLDDYIKMKDKQIRDLEENRMKKINATFAAKEAYVKGLEEKEAEKIKAKADKEREKEARHQAREEERARRAKEKEEEKARKAREKEEEKEKRDKKKAEEKTTKKTKKGGSKGDKGENEQNDENVEDVQEENDENVADVQDVSKIKIKIRKPVRFEEELELEKEKEDEKIGSIVEEYKDEDELEGDELLEQMGDAQYKDSVKLAMAFLKRNKAKYLSPTGLATYSPKFLSMLENIQDDDHIGLHLIYSQFRTLEGIGIFALTLEANGFARFKIKRTGPDAWDINMSEEDMGKPCYALYTGTEDAEEREIVRNIYNGTWDYIPNNIASALRQRSSNNNLGEIVKVFMITSAGSEGINLRNTRYVHIMEPYWHPVRSEQVIGRARRICSHQSLPKELQTVEVFVYIMTLTKQQIEGDFAIELRLKDLSKLTNQPQTSDEKLFEISNIKEQISSQILKSIKEASIDCATHVKSSSKEGLTCLSFGKTTNQDFAYHPNYVQDENDTIAAINRVKIDWEARPFKFTDPKTGIQKQYVLRVDTNQVYTYESVVDAAPGTIPVLIGKLVKRPGKKLGDKAVYEIVRE